MKNETAEEYKKSAAATVVAEAAAAAAKAVRDAASASAVTLANNDRPISWFQVNNLIPIVTSAVMIALSFAALNTRLSVVENKLDTIIASQNKMEQTISVKLYDIETRYGNLSLDVKKLDANQTIVMLRLGLK